MTAADMMAIMVFDSGRVRLKQDFTDDREALRRVIADLARAADEGERGVGGMFDSGGAFGEDNDTFNLFATDRQLAALQTAVTDLGPLPERKTLIYLGSGLRLSGADNMAQLRATVNAGVRANVTINPIDTRGLVATPPWEVPRARRQVARRSIQYETGFTLLPGSYVIKVLARNTTTGRIGTFQTSFTIPNLQREKVRLPISTVVLTSQRLAAGDALYTVKQKISGDIANPLMDGSQKLVPSVTRIFSMSRPSEVFLQAYERDAAAMRPLVAYVTFSQGGANVLETEPIGLTDGWDPKSGPYPFGSAFC